MPETSTTNDDEFFSANNAINFKSFAFNEVGDRVKGVYVGKFKSISKYGNPPPEVENYILVQDNGEKIVVMGRQPKDKKSNDFTKVFWGMDKIPLGAVVGFVYVGNKENGTPNATKLVEPRYSGTKNPEVLADFQSTYDLGAIEESFAEETEPVESVEEPVIPEM